MNISTKKYVYPSVIVLIYVLAAYMLFTYYATSVLTLIFCLPLSIGFIVGYGAGDFVGYLFIVLEILLIWYLIFLIVRKRLNKQFLKEQILKSKPPLLRELYNAATVPDAARIPLSCYRNESFRVVCVTGILSPTIKRTKFSSNSMYF